MSMKSFCRKMTVKIAAGLLSLGVFVHTGHPVLAAAEHYTYTVRFFSGAQGTFNGGEMIVHKDLEPGERVTFNQRDVTLNDNSKYYVKGIRESGKDNNRVGKDGQVEQTRTSFEVEEDRDYVVVYGLLGDAVSYTVNYLDAGGNELAPSETYYGNVGDAPVIAYLYIDGYQPQAYNMTGVLDRDASKNVFSFVYTPITAGTQQPGTQPTTAPTQIPAPQGTTAPAPGITSDTTGDETGEDVGDEGGGDAADDAAAGEDAGETAGEEGNGPEELEQIGDEEVPLADMGSDSGLAGLTDDFATRIGDLPFAAKIGICSAVLLALGVAGYFLLGRRKKAEIE